MIDAKELRIGNIATKWVRTPFGEEFKVRSPYALNIDDIAECSKGTAIFKGVALTEEILLRCGSENLINSATGRTSFDIGSLMFENEEGGFCVFGSEWTIGKPFYYLHQLQNLYFALTGEELICKLK